MPISNQEIHPNLLKVIKDMDTDPTGNSLHKKALGQIRKSPADQHNHPVFTISVDNLVKGKSFDSAIQTGWRIFGEADRQHMAFEFGIDEAGNHELHSVNEGFHIQGITKMLREINSRTEIKDRNYTLALLQIPPLFLEAAWLKAANDAGGDLFIPIDPAPSFVQADRIYPAQEFEEILIKHSGEVHVQPEE